MGPVEVSIVVPMYNEEDNVEPLYAAVTAAMPEHIRYELICVDDCSSDETLSRLAKITAADDRVRAISLGHNAGQTPAMVAGIDHAQGGIIVTMDGDLQNDPSDIPMLLEEIAEGYDIVVGYRLKRQDRLITRKIPSWIANRIIAKVTGVSIRDNGCSLKAYRAKVIQGVPLYSEMHRFIPAMTSLAGTRVKQVPVKHHARIYGESKYGLSRTIRVIGDLIVVRTLLSSLVRPLRFFAHLAVFGSFTGLAYGVIGVRNWLDDSQYFMYFAGMLLWLSLSLFLVFLGIIVELYADMSENRNDAVMLAKLTQNFDG